MSHFQDPAFRTSSNDGDHTILGSTTDAAATAGGTGSLSAKLRVISASIGAIADAMVAVAANGSVIALLKRVTQGLEDLKTGVILAAGSAIIGKVGIDQTTPGTTDRVTVGGTTVIAVTPTITAAVAYTAKDAVGGKLTFTSAARTSGGSGVIHAVTLIDKDSEAAELVLVIFDRDFTATADADAFDPTDADLANVIAKITIVATDYQTFADNGVAQKAGLGIPFVCSGSANLYGQLMCTATPTYTGVSDLIVKLHVLMD